MAKGKKGGSAQPLRTPIVCVMGHVDHGKTTLLDRIRGTLVTAREAGDITQHIGATEVPLSVVKELCGGLLPVDIYIPGLLFIDTPGHHAFTTLRRRGGSLSDIAVVVIDVQEGFQPQTVEVIRILKNFKTPFVVLANKIDRIRGWRSVEWSPFLKSYESQAEHIKRELDDHFYKIIESLDREGISADRYDRIRDFTRNVAIIPTSAKTGEGIPDFLMTLIGLAQRYLESDLQYSISNPGEATILEVKEERGLGLTLDAILYDGTIKVGDDIVLGGFDGLIHTRVRALLKPRPLKEMRMEERFKGVKDVPAAAGLKIAAPGLERAMAGAPLVVVRGDVAEAERRVQEQLEDIQIITDTEGIVVCADALGSLEALVMELREAGIPIRSASVGDISRRDVVDTATVSNELYRVLLGFNVDLLPDAVQEVADSEVQVFISNVIYRLIDDYNVWVKAEKERREAERLEQLIYPGKLNIMPDCVFHQSKPAVVGVRILEGRIRPEVMLIKPDGTPTGKVLNIQQRGENLRRARAGEEVAISIEGVTVGRQIKENDILLVEVPERHAKVLEHDLYDSLTADEKECLDMYLRIKRKEEPFWAK